MFFPAHQRRLNYLNTIVILPDNRILLNAIDYGYGDAHTNWSISLMNYIGSGIKPIKEDVYRGMKKALGISNNVKYIDRIEDWGSFITPHEMEVSFFIVKLKGPVSITTEKTTRVVALPWDKILYNRDIKINNITENALVVLNKRGIIDQCLDHKEMI
jgi:hypothetical protein